MLSISIKTHLIFISNTLIKLQQTYLIQLNIYLFLTDGVYIIDILMMSKSA